MDHFSIGRSMFSTTCNKGQFNRKGHVDAQSIRLGNFHCFDSCCLRLFVSLLQDTMSWMFRATTTTPIEVKFQKYSIKTPLFRTTSSSYLSALLTLYLFSHFVLFSKEPTPLSSFLLKIASPKGLKKRHTKDIAILKAGRELNYYQTVKCIFFPTSLPSSS